MVEALIVIVMLALSLTPSVFLFNMFKNFQADRKVGRAEYWAEKGEWIRDIQELNEKMKALEDSMIVQADWDKKMRDAEEQAQNYLEKVKL